MNNILSFLLGPVTFILFGLIIPVIFTIIYIKKLLNYNYKNVFFVFFGIVKPWLICFNILMFLGIIENLLIEDSQVYISLTGAIILFSILIIILIIEKAFKIYLLKKEKVASKICSKESNWYKH